MADVEIQIRDEQVKKLLRDLNSRLKDMRPLMSLIKVRMLSAVQTNFIAQGRPAWEKLRPSTIAQRTKIGKWPGKILQRSSGGLLASVQTGARSDSTTARVGSNKVYARTMQYGARKGEFGTVTARIKEHTRKTRRGKVKVKEHTRRMIVPWGKITARPFLSIPDDDMDGIRNTIRRYAVNGDTK